MAARRKLLLSDGIEEFLTSRAGDGYRPNTLKGYRGTLTKLLLAAGNIPIDRLGSQHIDIMFGQASKTCGEATLNQHQTDLSSFFKWCRSRHLMAIDHDPLTGRRPRRPQKKDRLYVSPSQFSNLLTVADDRHPRDRMIVALGLYLFLRQSEIATLRVRDVHLNERRIDVTVHKTRDFDSMVIGAELDYELRSWLKAYQALCGPLNPEWYLVPSRVATPSQRAPSGHFVASGRTERLRPHRPVTRLHEIVNQAMTEAGVTILREDGSKGWTGCHTLRASGARALFEELRNEGYDGALATVASFLHHKNVSMTERYLGLGIERDIRNRKFSGEYLYPSLRTSATLTTHGDSSEGDLRLVR